MIGSTVDGKYEVLRLLGQGGMGAVYEVRHAGTNRHLALKVILAAEASKQRSLVVRLQREARAAGAIDSPHIGQVVDAGTDPVGEMPYLVMELLDGEDVQQVLNRVGPLRPTVALRIVAQACLGLGKAHETRVIHRDIKPANLFLARQGLGTPAQDGSGAANRELCVKVLDFGIAKLKQEDLGDMESGSLTRTGSVLGSPLYMSPEQARGAKAIDHRADLWSLGVVAYQLMTGRTPYQEIDALGELILAICSELPPCVQDFAPWVDPAVAATIHRALALDATERYQTAEEMFAALVAHLPAGPDGQPDLALREDMLLGPDDVVRSVAAPRLIAEMGRRPAITARHVSHHVITPMPSSGPASGQHGSGQHGSGQYAAGPYAAGQYAAGPYAAGPLSGSGPGVARVAAGLEAGPTLMVTPLNASQSTPGVASTGGGTQAGMSRSSASVAPAPPPRSRAVLAGVVAAAVVMGAGVALLATTAVRAPEVADRGAPPSVETAPAQAGPAPGGASAPPAVLASAPPAAAPVEVPAPPRVASPGAASAPAPASASAAASATSSGGAAAGRPAAPARSSTSGAKPPGSAPPAPPAPPAPHSGTTGFGDRK